MTEGTAGLFGERLDRTGGDSGGPVDPAHAGAGGLVGIAASLIKPVAARDTKPVKDEVS